MKFEQRLELPVSQGTAFDWHMCNGAFERLVPPWETIRSIHAEPLSNDSRRIFEIQKGPLWVRWVARHQDVVAQEGFVDVQERGPFQSWVHAHRFVAKDANASSMVDAIDYALPLGFLGQALGQKSIEADLRRMFAYRHAITLGDLSAHAQYANKPTLRIAISGASGLIGRQLVAFLRGGGHQVITMVRSNPKADEVAWSVDKGVHDLAQLEGIDAVIHLAGANIAQRWNTHTKRIIEESRVLGTRAWVASLSKLERKPRVFISASAVGYYGDTGADVVDERAPCGEGFLADVCQAWEEEARRAEDYGCRCVQLRLGVVLDPRGGALQKLLPIARMGALGPVGTGKQQISWVGLDDVLGACLAALHEDTWQGPYNVVGPKPATQRNLARTLGRVLSRPTCVPTPALAIRALYGAMGEATILGSTGAKPSKLEQAGFAFRAPTLEAALRHCLGR